MNDNRQLLRLVNLDLHGPALETLNAMLARRIRVVLQVPKNATEKNRAQSCSFEIKDATVTIEDPMNELRTTLSDTVARYNERRKTKLKAYDNKLSFAPVPKPKQ